MSQHSQVIAVENPFLQISLIPEESNPFQFPLEMANFKSTVIRSLSKLFNVKK